MIINNIEILKVKDGNVRNGKIPSPMFGHRNALDLQQKIKQTAYKGTYMSVRKNEVLGGQKLNAGIAPR